MIAVILKMLNKYINSDFSSWILFFVASAIFQDFLPNQIHITKIPSWFLETQGSTIYSLNGLLRLSRASQDGIDATVSKLFVSSAPFVLYLLMCFFRMLHRTEQ